MKVLLVAATNEEIAPITNKGNLVETLICGVGIPATIYHLTKKLLHESFDIVIQAGIAGTFSKKFHPGEVVIVKQDAFADIGVMENKKMKTVFDMGFGNRDEFPFTNGVLVNNSSLIQYTGLKKVNAITVNTITDSEKQNKHFKKLFNADIESMEGAAFHYVCLQQRVPFLQIRAVSNQVGERDKSKWRIKEAIENLEITLSNNWIKASRHEVNPGIFSLPK